MSLMGTKNRHKQHTAEFKANVIRSQQKRTRPRQRVRSTLELCPYSSTDARHR
jgi:hypothetical protein